MSPPSRRRGATARSPPAATAATSPATTSGRRSSPACPPAIASPGRAPGWYGGAWKTTSARQELFVRYVTLTRVGPPDEALADGDAVDDGLPAGIFTRDNDEVARFVDEIEAGVVYVNRRAGATIGAWPGIQSFCGWKSSGSTGKGGLGPYYVQQFMREQSRTVVED